MGETPPEVLAGMLKGLGGQDSSLGRFVQQAFGAFQFEGIRLTPPTRTFEGQLALEVGAKRVELHEVGPAHTKGDVLVHLPAEGVVWSGDILFVEGTPIVWAGPVRNWQAACDRILAMDAALIVPGHGPITDRRGVVAVKAYLDFVEREARARFEAGLDAWSAARDIELGEFADWRDSERLAVNVDSLYREWGGAGAKNVLELFERMAQLRRPSA